MSKRPLDLKDFGIVPKLGFLTKNPVQELPRQYADLEKALAQMPQHLAAYTWGPVFESIKVPSLYNLRPYYYERLHQLLAYAVSGYVLENWREGSARDRIHAGVAVPFVEVSRKLGRHPILAYADYALNNYRLKDPEEPIVIGNIEVPQRFVAGPHARDERWFILVHIEIEAHAGTAIDAAVRMQEAAMNGDMHQCEHELLRFMDALKRMNAAFDRMPEECDPEIYFNYVRPWIWGWKNNPFLPNGVVYEGVMEFRGVGQFLRGETGAQSSFAPLVDHVFGVVHQSSILSAHLAEMRGYMPHGHQLLIKVIEKRPSIRDFVAKHKSLYAAYNGCLGEIWRFRRRHLEYAGSYIHRQAHTHGTHANSTTVGTGGTPFMDSLKKHVDETLEATL